MPDAKTIAIGAPKRSYPGNQDCYVQVFKWSMNSWVQKGSNISGVGGNDNFGHSISMPDSNTIAIGSPSHSSSTEYGYVRVYSWNGSNWTQKGIDIAGVADFDRTGNSVYMPNPNILAIGEPGYDQGQDTDIGRVRIFTWQANSWTQLGNDIIGESKNDGSGTSICMPNQNTIAVGSPYADVQGGYDEGHVRIFSWNGSTWVQKGNSILGESSNDRSGFSLSMPNANTIAIGAPFNHGNGTGSGHVRVYAWQNDAWIQKGVDLDGESPADRSGWSVCMPNINYVAIGAPGNSNGKGQVRLFGWDGNNWVQNGTGVNGKNSYDEAGFSVCMPDSNTLGVGSPAIIRYDTSSAVIYTISNPNSTDQFNLKQGFIVFPNPSNDAISIKNILKDFDENTIVVLYDLLGNEMHSKVLGRVGNTYKLDVRHLKAGVYILQVVNEHNVLITERVIIQ